MKAAMVVEVAPAAAAAGWEMLPPSPRVCNGAALPTCLEGRIRACRDGKNWPLLGDAGECAHASTGPVDTPMTRPTPSAVGQVRIIGGRWRNTRLPVPDVAGLRPTGDRTRETLFNWLGTRLGGTRVVDLFAGSGALGLEAVSRGAAHATLVERDGTLAQSLRQSVQRLSATAQVDVVQADALQWLAGQPAGALDGAFVDPPFTQALWSQVLPLLVPAIAPGGWIYIESPLQPGPAFAVAPCSLHREARAGEVRFALYLKPAHDGADTLPADVNAAIPQ